MSIISCFFFFFQAEDGIRDYKVTGVQTCALPISRTSPTGSWSCPLWPGAESNCRHADFQSAALPTELPGRTYAGEQLSGLSGAVGVLMFAVVCLVFAPSGRTPW